MEQRFLQPASFSYNARIVGSPAPAQSPCNSSSFESEIATDASVRITGNRKSLEDRIHALSLGTKVSMSRYLDLAKWAATAIFIFLERVCNVRCL
jgi:hypothetical protein